MSDIVAPQVRDLEMLARQMTEWLAARMPAAEGLELTDFAYPRGAGQSHETILFDARWHEAGTVHAEGYVVRIKPGGFTVFPDDLFDAQYRLMRALNADGQVRVAPVYWLEEDPALLGAPFFLMRKMTGRVPVTLPPYSTHGWVAEATPEQRRRMWESAVRQLAAIQTVSVGGLGFLAGPPGARDGLAQEWNKYERFIAWLEEVRPWPVLRRGMERLERLWPKNQPPGLVWGDARMGNMMFGDDFEVNAVMDWEQPSLGGALNDLAWFCNHGESVHGATADRPHLPGMGTQDETVAMWERLTGKSAADLDWYQDFTRLKFSCMNVRMMHLRGAPAPADDYLAKRLKIA